MMFGEEHMKYTCEATQKFEPMAEELVPFLLSLLRECNRISKEVDAMHKEQETAKGERLSYQELQMLFQEKERRVMVLAKEKCTDELLALGCNSSFGGDGEYGYVDRDFELIFTMKSGKKATIETRFYKVSHYQSRHLFVLKLTEDGWRIHEKKYGYYGHGDDTWYKDKI